MRRREYNHMVMKKLMYFLHAGQYVICYTDIILTHDNWYEIDIISILQIRKQTD